MSFQTGLSGLNASSRNLDVIGHNIANANTTGMKASRAEFGAMYSSMLGYGGNSNGIGVQVCTVAQQFTQGSLSTTSNSLDVAINGNGFFQIKLTDGTAAYTRDGSFKLDKDGYIKTNSGANVMGFPTDVDGVQASVSIQALKMPTSAPIAAKQTDAVKLSMNLDARATPAVGLVGANLTQLTPRSTYGTSINVYDAQGVASPLNLYFEKDAAANTWNVYTTLDTSPAPVGQPVGSGGLTPPLKLEFDNNGHLVGPPALLNPVSTSATIPPPAPFFGFELPIGSIASLNPNDIAPNATPGFVDQVIMLDFGENIDTSGNAANAYGNIVTQYGNSFAIADLTQDGYTAGELTGLNIGEDGVISARYSNGQTQATGQIALADFRNAQGLTPLGCNAWAETFESGQPISGSAGVGKFGSLRAGALEDSNVELTQELVNMMTAQRAYQANAQTIKTQDQIMSTLVNLK